MAITLRKPIDHIGYQAILVKQVTYVYVVYLGKGLFVTAFAHHIANRAKGYMADGADGKLSVLLGTTNDRTYWWTCQMKSSVLIDHRIHFNAKSEEANRQGCAAFVELYVCQIGKPDDHEDRHLPAWKQKRLKRSYARMCVHAGYTWK